MVSGLGRRTLPVARTCTAFESDGLGPEGAPAAMIAEWN